MSLHTFIHKLEKHGELVRVKKAVSSDLEITELTDRISKQKDGGKALLFENTGTDYPIITNMLGSEKRIALALGYDDLETAVNELSAIVENSFAPQKSLVAKLKSLKNLIQLSASFPRRQRKKFGNNANYKTLHSLFEIPVLKCWKHDGGKFITLPMVITKAPETDNTNVGMYRIQLFEDKKCWVHWQKHKTGQTHFEKYKKLGKPMPVAIAIGGDPISSYAATAPLPEDINELMFAGVLRKKAIRTQRCQTVDLPVPADADFVIEGYIDTKKELTLEGPFGDHTGFYSLPDYYPMLEVTRITARKDAVYPATIVGVPPQEDVYIATATEKLFSIPIKKVIQPELLSMHLPPVGIAHNLALITIHSRYEGHAQQAMNSLWGAGQMSFTKVMVVGNNGNPENYETFARLCLANFNPAEDCTIIKGPADVLDHSARKFAFGGKIGLDCTGNKSPVDDWKPFVTIIEIPKTTRKEYCSFCENFLHENPHYKIVLTIDKTTDTEDYFTSLWMIFNNMDPAEDCLIMENTLFIDGSRKTCEHDHFERAWPNVVTMDLPTIEKVDNQWESYGLGEFIASPSRRLLPLVGEDSAFYDGMLATPHKSASPPDSI